MISFRGKYKGKYFLMNMDYAQEINHLSLYMSNQTYITDYKRFSKLF